MTEYNFNCFISILFMRFQIKAFISNMNILIMVHYSVPSCWANMATGYVVHRIERVNKEAQNKRVRSKRTTSDCSLNDAVRVNKEAQYKRVRSKRTTSDCSLTMQSSTADRQGRQTSKPLTLKRLMCCSWFARDCTQASWAYVLETVYSTVKRL